MSIDLPSSSPPEVTTLLRAWSDGDRTALDRLTPLVYEELRRQARLLMLRERPGHVLQPSALVNEAFLRLTRDAPVEWENRRQFFAVAAGLMRRILIDLARAQGTTKRGARANHIDLGAAIDLAAAPSGSELDPAELMDLDEALTKLAKLDERQAKVVELRFFGGLDIAEVALLLGVSEATVVRDWRLARAWLYGALHPSQQQQPRRP